MNEWNPPHAFTDYVARIGGEILNWRKAMVKVYGTSAQGKNYYVERTLIMISEDGEVKLNRDADPLHFPTDAERAAIRAGFEGESFPRPVRVRLDFAEAFREKLKVPKEKWFNLVSLANREEVIMCQERVDTAEGDKFYKPWTFFSKDGDGKWMMMELGGRLPFWKPPLRHLKKIMVHEGAKAARWVDWLCFSDSSEAKDVRSRHPWYDYLRDYEHWGINGGALAPHRADYSEIHGINPLRCVYVCDRDAPGEGALQKFSQQYREPLVGIKFDNRFLTNWDMADPLPEIFFLDGSYIGPTLKACEQTATWATEMVPISNGKKVKEVPVLKQKFKEEWFHVVTPEGYINSVRPNRFYSASEFNNKVAPFSDVRNVAELMKGDDGSKVETLSYSPDCSSGFRITKEKGRTFNVHVPGEMRPVKGNAGPFNDYLKNMFPDEKDRFHVKHWCATLVCCPWVKISYALLLVSETQGVGKTTLGQNILAPLVGLHNVRAPSETDIVDSQFTHWKSHTRLVLVNEIYEGQSKKCYDRLKSVITDQLIEVNLKFQAPYVIDNWVHVFACSNHKNALKLDKGDRRWLIPKVVEATQDAKYWFDFNRWLVTGGLNFIFWDLQQFIKKHGPIAAGAHSPEGTGRQSMIEDGMSKGELLIADFCSHYNFKDNGPVAIDDNSLRHMISKVLHDGRVPDRLESPLTIRKIARAYGYFVSEKRIATNRGMRLSRLVTNDKELVNKTWEELKQLNNNGKLKLLHSENMEKKPDAFKSGDPNHGWLEWTTS